MEGRIAVFTQIIQSVLQTLQVGLTVIGAVALIGLLGFLVWWLVL